MLYALGSGNITGWLISMLLSLPALLIAISFHEWAHAFSAYKLGDDTARNAGRMTLDPLKHIDPIGAIMLLVAGFGWAKPVPINPGNFKHRRRDENIVSLAGVFTNFVLAFLFAGIYVLIYVLAGVQTQFVYYLLQVVAAVITLNIGLGIFNLLPIPPLDGYHILRGFLVGRVQPQKLWNFERYARYGFLALLILSLVMNFIFNVSLFTYLGRAVTWIGNGFIDFWLLFVPGV